MDELRRVLNYKKFADPMARAGIEIDSLLYDFVNASLPGPLAYVSPDITNDPKDIHILALATGAHADYVVSSDKKHLISLGSYEGIPIITAAQFLKVLEQST